MSSALVVLLADLPGGAERVAATTARSLARMGWRVQVHVLLPPTERSFLGEALAETPVELTYGTRMATFWTLLNVLRRERRDLTFSTHIHLNGVLSLARNCRILQTRKLVSRESTAIFERFRGLRLAYYKALYALYGAQDMVIAQTDDMSRALSAQFSKQIARRLRVLPNPLDMERIRALGRKPLAQEDRWLRDGRRNVIFCGRLIPVKRPELAIAAFRRLKDTRGCDARLVFLGDGPLEAELKDRVAELGLADDVRFVGSRENPFQIMATADAGLLTSSTEGFPNAVLEMLACGANGVVVTPCAGGLNELPDVLVSSADSAEELASLLHRALDQEPSPERDNFLAARSVEGYVSQLLN